MSIARFATPLFLIVLMAVAACGKKSDDSAPLAFVPADTAFVIANSEPAPAAAVATWSRQMQGMWPIVTGMYERLLGELPTDGAADSARVRTVFSAILAELKGRDTPEKWAEIGFTTKARSAIYGVGMVPVLRIELANEEGFRAMIARVETNSGSKLATARIGDQDLWLVDADKAQAMIAIQGKHLVATILPSNADESLKRAVLGLDRPAKNLAEDGRLGALEKAEGYTAFGSGWLDFRRVASLIDNDPGYAAFARLADDAPVKLDPICRAEFDALAARAPRMVFGYTALDATRMSVSSRLDLDAELAAAFVALSSPPPGSAAPTGALYDMSLSLPILKIKDFLLARAEAVVAAPFACPALASWNEAATRLKGQLSQFVPPPLSDLTGLRLTIDRLSWPADGELDFSAKVLLASNNPMAMVGLAQLAVPALKDFAISADGKAVTLPAGVIPNQVGFVPEVHVALNANALAIGTGDAAGLSSYLVAQTAADGQLFRTSYSGEFYLALGNLMSRFSESLPEKERVSLQQQQELYALYASWIRNIDLRINATPKGIVFAQDAELTP
ncbi:MAG: hypothetical protein ABI650_10650 [Dokdonella sp.]